MMELTDAELFLQNSPGFDLGANRSYTANPQRLGLGDPFTFSRALSARAVASFDGAGQSVAGGLWAPTAGRPVSNLGSWGLPGDDLTARSLTAPEPIAPNLAVSTVAAATIAASPLAGPTELVFIDASLPDYDALLAAIKPHVAVFRLDAQQDGVTQISNILAGYQDISALHILSHGNVGALQLGSTWLNGDTLQTYAGQLTGWASHLTDSADILLYGCDVALGMAGDWFVHQFGNLTGADIAASTDLTGGTALGGNWTLEVNTGAIATDLIGQSTALADYHGILLTPLSAAQYTNLKAGVNDFLAVTQSAVDTLVFAQRLPLVGSQLASTTKVFQGIQTSLAAAWTTLEAIPPATLNSDDVKAAIATALASFLPSGVTVDESAAQLQFNLNLSKAVSSSLGFDLGLDAIGLSLTSGGAVTTQLGYSLPWKFGIDLASSQFYVDTSALDELKIDLAVTTPGLNATGKLGFLQVAVTGQDSQSQATSFNGQFRVDLRDPGGDGRLTAGELAGLTAAQLATPKFQAIADVNLGITTSFGGDARFPNLKTDLNLDWTFDPTNLSLLPTAAFNNVRMNLGGFFNEFVSPIFAEVQKVLGPVQPVFDVLRTRMPVLSDIGPLRTIYDVDGNGTVTLLEFIGVASGNTQAVSFIQAIDQIATFANSIPTGVGDLYIPLGNLRLNNSPTTDLRALPDLSGLNLANTSLFDDLTALLPGVDAATKNLVQGFRSNASNANFSGGLAFPLLQNPTTAFGLLLGRDVSVFTLDLPALGTAFNVSQFFPILGPLGVRLSGAFDIQADFNFGYDTAGFRQFATGGFTTPGLIFNGFYISDTANPDGTGPDVPEVRLNASIQAAGELNVIVAAAGVGGGLFANVNLDLRDPPPADGKIRLSELESNFSANGPLGIFDTSGKFTAGLNAYVRVGVDVPFVGFVGWEDSFDIASVTLLDFDTNSATLAPSPVLAQLDPGLGAGVLRLNMGTFAAQRLTGNIIDGDETFKVTRSPDGTQILVAAFGIVQAFAIGTIQKIYAEGGNGADVIDIAADVLLPVELWGDFKDPLKAGFGNDKLFAGGGVAILHGGAGNDELTVRAGNSQAFGDAGNDKLFGGTGNDTLDGGEGNDTLYGNVGNDSLLGGLGNDFLDAGVGDDVVRGGDGSDRIKGGDGNDTLFGDADNDIIEAGLGNDFAYGGDGNDFILDEGTIFVGPGDSSAPLPPGGSVLQNVTVIANGVVVQVQLGAGGGNDVFEGGAGNDALFGQAGNDTLSGNDGNDYVDGGSGNDILFGNNGDDQLSGGSDNDILLGDNGTVDASGVVTLGTGNGNDVLYGGIGNDTLYGQGGNDLLAGDGGDDRLFGNAGNDVLFGDSGQRVSLPGGGVRYESTNPNTLGNDTLDGGEDNDIAIGGAGNDLLLGTTGADIALIGDNGRVTFAGSGALLRVETTDASFGGNDTLLGSTAIANIMLGGSGNDSITGSITGDIILGDNGVVVGSDGTSDANDIFSTDPANGGNDTIVGAAGNDSIIGGTGNDNIQGNDGTDLIIGDSGRINRDAASVFQSMLTLFPTQGGNDTISGDGDADTILGGTGDDSISGGLDNAVDVLLGDNGIVYGADGSLFANDILSTDPANGGRDTISGGGGDDLIIGGSGSGETAGGEGDRLFGNAGNDIIAGDGAYIVRNASNVVTRIVTPTDSLPGDQNPNLGGNDFIEDTEGFSLILGGAGNDTINTGNGSDIIIGDAGEILFVGNQILQVQTIVPSATGNDVINAGNGADTVLGGSGNDSIIGGSDDAVDILLGDNGIVYGSDASLGVNANDIVSTDPTNGGQDTIFGGGGDDLIIGGSGGSDATGVGGDRLFGDAGNDIIIGDSGRITRNALNVVERIATLFPENGGDDQITDTLGTLIALGGSGNDTITGGDGADILLGDNGVVVGADGSAAANDIFSTDPTFGGTDSILGGAGNDTIIGGSGGADQSGPGLNDGDTLLGGAGDDIILGDSGYITRNAANVVETITTSFPTFGGDDSLFGNEGRDTLLGGFGNDTIAGNAGDDIILGDSGRLDYTLDENLTTLDRILSTDTGIGGNDSITGDDGNDIALGGAANDTISGNAGDDILLGDNGQISFSGGLIARIETIAPNDGGNDVIAGNDGSDRILGGAANDAITGDNGNDIILGDHGVLDYGVDLDLTTLDIVTSTDPTLGGRDTIQGNDGNDIVLGGADNDSITGGMGTDTLLGDNGQILYTTGKLRLIQTLNSAVGGNDSIQGNQDNDLILGGFGDDSLEGNQGDDKILGDNGFMDYAYGGDATVAADTDFSTLDFITTTNPTDGGRDRILGGAGNDQILGGTGDDTIYGDDGIDGLGAEWKLVSTGDFNGDGKSDMFWRNSVDNRTLVWLMNGTSIIDSNYLYNVDTSWVLEGTIDFNGDGKSDFLWRNVVDGDVGIWLMNGKKDLANGYVSLRHIPLNWDIRGVGDFNGDGKGDILWRNDATGEIHTWLMNGISIIDNGLVGPSTLSADWNQIAIGDFNGDGKDDLLWRQSGDRTDIWLMNGRTMQSSTLMSGGIADWQVMGLTDLNGDRRQDLVWRQTGSGRVAVWLMNGSTPLATPLIGPAAIDNSWQVVELGDVNGDGKGDILWRQTGGGMTVWLMDGSTVIADQGIAPAVLSASWQPIGFGDFDGDGRRDIFWQFNRPNNDVTTSGQNNGDLSMWLMEGTTKTSDAVYSVVPELIPSTGRFDDLILGDHGKVYEALPRDRNYLSIDTGAADGGGNDLIYGNQGDDFILGQQGSDRIFGGAGEDDIIGGHNVIGGADGNDLIDGGANADVELGDNGRITRRPLGNGWQRYPNPFPDVIRDVVRFDDVDGISGNDTVNGGGGDDILYGQRGNDVMDGGAGDDEMYGNLGNDVMQGGAGQDFLLGDVGAILRAYNPDGTPRINTNGSWHRDALLTDVATITDVWNSAAVPSSVYATADLLLLNGLYNPDGTPVQNAQTQVQALTFIPAGNDTLAGGSGDDALFGQSGDDSISDSGGSNYIEGNEGNDTISGGSGDDFIIGDNSENVAPFNQQIPTVTHGLHIIQQTAGLNFDLGQFGTIVIPNATLTPNMSSDLLAALTLAPRPVQGPGTIPAIANLTRNGTTYQPLAAIIPDISNHLDQLAGNDVIRDSGGNNTLVGDNYRSFSPLRTNSASGDQALSQLTTQIYQLLYDLHDLEIAQSAGKPAKTLAVGNDTISGGVGRDLVFADDETLYSSITAMQPSNLPSILQTVADLRQALSQLNAGITTQLNLYTGAIASPYTLSLSNDIISGGSGNDQLMAGDTLVFSPMLDGFNYQPGSLSNYSFDRTPKAVRPNFQDFNLTLNNDIVYGDNLDGSGTGNDLIVGGYSTLIMPVLTQAATTATQAAALRQSLAAIVRDVTSVVRDLHNEQYGIAYANRNQANTLIAENDTLFGGAGNDVIFGDTVTFTTPFLNGQANLGLALPEAAVDYTEEPYNFAQALPHLYDFAYRNLNTLQIGKDAIQGGTGDDILFGQRWSDTLQGQDGNDYLFGGREAENILDGGSGTNVIRATSPSPTDQQAIAPSINARLAELPSPALQRYLLEILANRNALAPKGNLFVSFP